MTTAAEIVETTEHIDTRIGSITTEVGTPTKESVTKLYDEMDFQRACQAYLWGMPAVAMAQWKKSTDDLHVRNGQLTIFASYEEKLGILTPNYTTPYVVGVADLEKSGPLVFEVPKGLTAGMALDAWQRVLTDTGVVGPDQGKGGKYLFVGPGQTVPEDAGYIVVHSPTFSIFYGVRLLDADEAKAIKEFSPLLLCYPYSERNNIPKEQTARLGDRKFCQIQPSGMAYWERLAGVVQHEPVEERDRLILAHLRSLGIEKGKPFQPDARQKQILTDAAKVGELMAKALSSDKRFAPVFWPGTSWKDATLVGLDQRMPNYDQFDERAACFYEPVTISKGMKSEEVGSGSRYFVTYVDKDGDLLDGGKSYRLHVPPNPPARQFWSVTAYDETTRSFVVSPTKKTDLSSRKPDLEKNADGSVDVFFGPTEPKGHEKNWVQTVPGKGWFPYFRFYAPTEAFFDKSWALADIEKVK
jgi:hypothetical protein